MKVPLAFRYVRNAQYSQSLLIYRSLRLFVAVGRSLCSCMTFAISVQYYVSQVAFTVRVGE